MTTPLQFSNIELLSNLFPYVVSPEVFAPDAGHTILAWLESDAPWTLVETSFYEQFECSLWDVQLPTGLSFLREPTFLTALKKQIADLFGVNLSYRVDITAHKLVPGQR